MKVIILSGGNQTRLFGEGGIKVFQTGQSYINDNGGKDKSRQRNRMGKGKDIQGTAKIVQYSYNKYMKKDQRMTSVTNLGSKFLVGQESNFNSSQLALFVMEQNGK